MSEISLKDKTWYITAGDYLVFIEKNDHGDFLASLETSPGTTRSGFRPDQLWSPAHGWRYKFNGIITGLSGDWNEKLRIVEEYPYPVQLPNGFMWKDGFPKLYRQEELSSEEYYIGRSLYGEFGICKGKYGGNYIQNNSPDLPFMYDNNIKLKRIGLVEVDKPVESPITVPTPVLESTEEMKKETAIAAAKVAGNLGFRALNYWFFEPAVNTFRPVVKGVRYAVFLSTLASVVYGYKHPETVKSAIMRCLPSVTIEAPEILK